jgi:hypothetical protein
MTEIVTPRTPDCHTGDVGCGSTRVAIGVDLSRIVDGMDGGEMTDTNEREAIHEALAVIDRGLGEVAERSLMSATEVADLLLDLRTLLTRPEAVSAN